MRNKWIGKRVRVYSGVLDGKVGVIRVVRDDSDRDPPEGEEEAYGIEFPPLRGIRYFWRREFEPIRNESQFIRLVHNNPNRQITFVRVSCISCVNYHPSSDGSGVLSLEIVGNKDPIVCDTSCLPKVLLAIGVTEKLSDL